MRIQFSAATSFPFPASRSAIRLRFHGFDFVWALLSPLAALYLSDAYILHSGYGTKTIALYWVVTFATTAVTLFFFRVHEGVARYFSVYDALSIGKAVVVSELISCIILFSATRLDGIPRAAPIIHALTLAAGLIAARTWMRVTVTDRPRNERRNWAREHAIILGANSLSSLYIKFLQICSPQTLDVVAVLDPRKDMFGRTIEGVRIVGSPEQLDPILAEYSVHGIEISRVIIAGNTDLLSSAEMAEVDRLCKRRRISLNFMSQLLGLQELGQSQAKSASFHFQECADVRPSHYFKWKYAIDFLIASALIFMMIPLLVCVAIVVMLDSGLPVLFWQQRIGGDGIPFLLYKFRTLRPPFDWKGNPTPKNRRLSRIGRVLREMSLDEFPQLLNVLVGDMSLIGPRPLLPEDQPLNPSIRLLVRPGITGWAQIHGGKLLTAEEKDKLDEWYVRNASLWVDLGIMLQTAKILLIRSRSAEASADVQEIETRGSNEKDGHPPTGTDGTNAKVMKAS